MRIIELGCCNATSKEANKRHGHLGFGARLYSAMHNVYQKWQNFGWSVIMTARLYFTLRERQVPLKRTLW